MASVNKVILVGNLGRDPESRTFPNGDQVTNVTIATTDKWRDKQTGDMKEATEWHRVVFHGRLAEIAAQYLRKGSQVYVEGTLRTRSWERDGVKQYATEIRADQMQMLGNRQTGDGSNQGQAQHQQQGGYRSNAGGQQPQSTPSQTHGYAPQQAAQPPHAGSGFDDMDDDIAF